MALVYRVLPSLCGAAEFEAQGVILSRCHHLSVTFRIRGVRFSHYYWFLAVRIDSSDIDFRLFLFAL